MEHVAYHGFSTRPREKCSWAGSDAPCPWNLSISLHCMGVFGRKSSEDEVGGSASGVCVAVLGTGKVGECGRAGEGNESIGAESC